jgi:hypothetical protein
MVPLFGTDIKPATEMGQSKVESGTARRVTELFSLEVINASYFSDKRTN